MSAGEAAPSVVKGVVVCLGADGPHDKGVTWGAGRGLATGNEVGSWAPNGVLDHFCDEGGEKEGDKEAEDCNMGLVGAWAGEEDP
jgi:hypothetical protein